MAWPSRHAVRRYRERIESVSEAEARARLEKLGAPFGPQPGVYEVIVSDGARRLVLVLDAGAVVTVWPA